MEIPNFQKPKVILPPFSHVLHPIPQQILSTLPPQWPRPPWPLIKRTAAASSSTSVPHAISCQPATFQHRCGGQLHSHCQCSHFKHTSRVLVFVPQSQLTHYNFEVHRMSYCHQGQPSTNWAGINRYIPSNPPFKRWSGRRKEGTSLLTEFLLISSAPQQSSLQM